MWIIADRFYVLKHLGGGGMGNVYLCQERAPGSVQPDPTKPPVAVKILDRAAIEGPDSDYLAALAREFKLLRLVESPYIVKVFDSGTFRHEGRHTFYFSMEWVIGDHFIDYRFTDYEEVCEVILQITAGLQPFHFCGRIHGDVKPGNIIITRIIAPSTESKGSRAHGYPRTKLMDLGLSCKTGVRSRLEFEGTPYYAPPESIPAMQSGVASASEVVHVDHRADLYSLGCVLYHLLAGRPPYLGTAIEVLEQHADPRVQPPDLPDTSPAIPGVPIPDPMKELIARLLATERGGRFDSCLEMAAFVQKNLLRRKITLEPEASVALATAIHYVDPDGDAARLAERVLAGVDRRTEAPRVFLLEGRAGIGKTRLLREVRRQVADQAVTFIRGSGSDDGLDRIGRKLAATLGTEQEQSSFHRRFPHLSLVRSRSAALDGARVKDMVQDLEGAIREYTDGQRRLVIAIDDVQQADHDVLRVVLEAVLKLDREPVVLMLVGTTDLAPQDVADLLQGVSESKLVERVRVSPFDHRRAEQYLHAVLGSQPSLDFVDYVMEVSRGIPSAVVATARSLVQADMLRTDGDSTVALVRRPGARMALGQDIPRELREVLIALAVLRRPASISEIEAFLRGTRPESPIKVLLDELVGRGLAEWRDVTHYQVGGALADSVLEDLAEDERIAAHRRAANVLAGSELPGVRVERVRHLAAAGDLKGAALDAIVAAREQRARPHLTLAMEMAGVVVDAFCPSEDPAHRRVAHEALVLRGDCQIEREQIDRALHTYRQALAMAADDSRMAQERGTALQRIGRALTTRRERGASEVEAAEALDCLDRALAIARVDESEERLRLRDDALEDRARLFRSLERSTEALVEYESLLSLRRERGAPTDAVLVSMGECRALDFSDAASRERGLREIEEGLEEARERSDTRVVASAHHRMGRVFIGMDRLGPAIACCRRAMELYRNLGLRTKENSAMGNLVMAASHAGPFTDTATYAQVLFERQGSATANSVSLRALIALARVLLHEGKYVESLRAARQAAEAIETLGITGLSAARIVEGRVLGELGRLESLEIVRRAREGRPRGEQLESLINEAQVRVSWLRGRSDRSDAAGLVTMLREARHLASQESQLIFGCLADAALAEALSVLSDGADAAEVRRLCDEALDRIWQTDTPNYVLQVHYHAARAALGIGDKPLAARYCDLAVSKLRVWVWHDSGFKWRLLAMKGALALDSGCGDEAAEFYVRASEIIDRLGNDLVRNGEQALAASFFVDPLVQDVLEKSAALLKQGLVAEPGS